MKNRNEWEWKKSWIYSKINNVIFLIIFIKKIKTKIIIINFIIESKNIFYYKFSLIIKKIKNIIIKNLKKLNYKSRNFKKLEIMKTIMKNNILQYKIETNNNILKIKNISLLINNEFKFWKKENKKISIIIIIIIINIIDINIKLWKMKKLNIKYKICGKIYKNINIINIQQLEYLIEWLEKSFSYLKEKLYLQNIKRKRKIIINI